MQKSDAHYILLQQLLPYRSRSYQELAALVEAIHIETAEVRSFSGLLFKTEIQFLWDDQPDDSIRVVGAITDGGASPFVPLAYSFVVEKEERMFAPSGYAV